MSPPHQSPEPHGLWSPSRLVLIAFLAIAAFFLITEHRAHVLGALPYVLLLLCPLLHMFLHGRHGHAHHDDSRRQGRSSSEGEA